MKGGAEVCVSASPQILQFLPLPLRVPFVFLPPKAGENLHFFAKNAGVEFLHLLVFPLRGTRVAKTHYKIWVDHYLFGHPVSSVTILQIIKLIKSCSVTRKWCFHSSPANNVPNKIEIDLLHFSQRRIVPHWRNGWGTKP